VLPVETALSQLLALKIFCIADAVLQGSSSFVKAEETTAQRFSALQAAGG